MAGRQKCASLATGACPVPRSARRQCALELVGFCLAPGRFRLRGHRLALGTHRLHYCSVLAPQTAGRVTVDPVPGLGHICGSTALDSMASESWGPGLSADRSFIPGAALHRAGPTVHGFPRKKCPVLLLMGLKT